MGKNDCDTITRKQIIKKDINEKTQISRKDQKAPAKEENDNHEITIELITDENDAKAQEVFTSDIDKASAMQTQQHFIVNLSEKLVKERERLQRSHDEAMKCLDSLQASLNDFTQGELNLLKESLESKEMTETPEDEEDSEDRRRRSYLQISKAVIKDKSMCYIEMFINKKKILVGPYSHPKQIQQALPRYYERSKYLSASAFVHELKLIKNLLVKRNAYKFRN